MPSKWPTTSRQSRGYGRQWEITRLRILKRDNHLCTCSHCVADKIVRAASEVDHRVSKAKAAAMGWTNAQIESDSNLGAINRDCHKRKTIEEQGHRPRPAIGSDGYPLTAFKR